MAVFPFQATGSALKEHFPHCRCRRVVGFAMLPPTLFDLKPIKLPDWDSDLVGGRAEHELMMKDSEGECCACYKGLRDVQHTCHATG